MPYFRVEQLFDLVFSENLPYVLPQSVKVLLTELESCLEITDAVPETSTDRREYKSSSDARRQNTSEGHQVKYRNRYDTDNVQQGTAQQRGGRQTDNRDKRRQDYKQKEPVTEWRSASASAFAVKTDSSSASAATAEADAEWELMRSFKVTKIESKTGIEKTVNDLRIALNKISAANYEKQRDAIFVLVNGYFDASTEEVCEANTRRISKAIFDIASTNKFYSEIYAKLYKELVESHSVFGGLLEELVRAFMALENIPVYVDPDHDYDGFCAYSKACDIRKSTSMFLVNCLKLNVVESSSVTGVLCEFLKYVDEKRNESGFSKCVEEIVENIYIIATSCSKELKKTDKWQDSVLPTIKRFVSEKGTTFPSMSNRAIFKFLDILENV
jgi:hypothetical protein